MKIAAAIFSLLIILFLLAPFLVLIPMSFGSADIAEFPHDRFQWNNTNVSWKANPGFRPFSPV